jgi:hypothetical protein
VAREPEPQRSDDDQSQASINGEIQNRRDLTGNGVIDDNDILPYCDKVPYYAGQSVDTCWDRQDASDASGLYPCNDGTYNKNWEDCKDAYQVIQEGE